MSEMSQFCVYGIKFIAYLKTLQMDFTLYKAALYQYFNNAKNTFIAEQKTLVKHKEDNIPMYDENMEFDEYGNPTYLAAFSIKE